ncbi:MAG: isoamylase [Treponema sp.]|nr:isoamylase [Treponema sp.]
MKRIFCLILTALLAVTAFAKEAAPEQDLFEFNNLVSEMQGVRAPYQYGKYVVFTAPNNSRYVGIAFDFEGYKQIHAYKLHKAYDFEGEVTDSWFFYVLKKPKDVESISYRIVIDGLWTTDPTNTNTLYDTNTNLWLSHVNLPRVETKNTETVPAGYTRFVCFAPTGQKIRVGGTFTNWDSWIYELKEVQRGKYQLDIPLPSGTYYYNYYRGITSFIDETNPEKGYTADGRIASRIVVR